MASEDNRITFRLDDDQADDVAAAMRFLGIKNKSDFLRQAVATELRRTKREMAAEGHTGHVAEDQAPYGVQRPAAKSEPGAGFARRASQAAPEALEAVDRAFAAVKPKEPVSQEK